MSKKSIPPTPTGQQALSEAAEPQAVVLTEDQREAIEFALNMAINMQPGEGFVEALRDLHIAAMRTLLAATPAPATADVREPTDDELREGVKAFQHAWANDNPLADWRAFWRATANAMSRSDKS